MGIEFNTYKLKDLISNIRDHSLLLPNFQRDYVWKAFQQERLAISCILGLPVGGVLMLKGEHEDFSYRNIAGISSGSSIIHKYVQFLLDGQQRLTTLSFLFDDPFNNQYISWDDVCRQIPESLKKRYFLDISFHESGSDPLGCENLNVIPIGSLEPGDLENRIKTFKVNITGTGLKQPEHPKFYITEIEKQKREGARSPEHAASHQLVKSFSQKIMVPLFTVFWENNSNNIYPYKLHERVIEAIADERLKEIRSKNALLEGEDLSEYFDSIHIGLSNEITDPETGELDVEKGWMEIKGRWVKHIQQIFHNLSSMELPSTDLPSDEISRAASIFEELNDGGTKLRVFDLLVARAARDKSLGTKTLVDYINELVSEKIDISVLRPAKEWVLDSLGVKEGNSLQNIFQDAYLDMLSLLHHAKDAKASAADVKYIKKNAILSIPPKDINNKTERVITGLSRSFAFLQSRCGISKYSDVPYWLMLLPMAYCLEEDDVWNEKSLLDKIEYWYWDSLFTGKYRDRQNERCVLDVEKLYNWIVNGEKMYKDEYSPSVLGDTGYNDLSTLVHSDIDNLPNENVAKSIRQFILAGKPNDFSDKPRVLKAWEITSGDVTVEKHHIIPLANAKNISDSTSELRGDKNHILNSPLNFTLISKEANNKIGGMSLTDYSKKIESTSLANHLMPDSHGLSKNTGEADEDYYKRLLTLRYNNIKISVINKLSLLR